MQKSIESINEYRYRCLWLYYIRKKTKKENKQVFSEHAPTWLYYIRKKTKKENKQVFSEHAPTPPM